jgi:tetratricopeptide (TPR) repeat protein
MNDQHEVVVSVEGQEYARSFVVELQKNLDALGEELKADGFNYQIAPVRGPPEVRLIEGNTPEQRRWNAEKVAAENGADIVLYGYLDINPLRTTLMIEFYVSDQFLRDAEELTGAQQLGDPKVVGADIQANVEAKAELRADLENETRAFALFLIGLGHFGLEHYKEAEDFFDKAIDAESLGDPTIRKIYYLFAGKAAHEYAVNLPRDEQWSEWTKAQDYYSQSLHINQDYARARLGYADIAFQKAKDNCGPGDVDARGLQEAIDGYQQALKAEDQIPDANIDNKTAFYLGRAYICQSMAGVADHWAEALIKTKEVISQTSNGADAQNESMQMRRAEAYANLGLIYWQGPSKDLRRAADQYVRAIEVNRQFVDSNRRLDRQALFNKQLAEIYEALRSYVEADAAWGEALRYEALWYKTVQQAMPIPSPYQQRREKFAADRAVPTNAPVTVLP